MRPSDAKICPACGAKGRANWEFCARCGESLAGADTVAKAAARAAKAERAAKGPAFKVSEAPAEAGSPLLTAVVLLLGFALVGSGIYFAVRQRPPQEPQPAMFVAPTLPPGPPLRPPLPVPDLGDEDYQKGLLFLARGDAASAEPFLAKAVQAAPRNYLYRHSHGRALQALQRYDEAAAEYGEAASLSPDTVRFAVDHARVLEQADRLDDADGAYSAILVREPRNVETLEALGMLRLRRGDHKGAIEPLRTLSGMRDRDLALAQLVGWACEQGGEPDAAVAEYQRILRSYPTATITRGRLAEVLVKQGRGAEAVALMQEGVSAEPGSPLLRRSLASVLERNGQTREAIEAYREYARLAPNAPDATQLATRAAALERQLGRSSS